jgi:hypothetical protein
MKSDKSSVGSEGRRLIRLSSTQKQAESLTRVCLQKDCLRSSSASSDPEGTSTGSIGTSAGPRLQGDSIVAASV